jgi:hypothetical protein
MLRFNIEVLVRYGESQDNDCCSEKPMMVNLTAENEFIARRLALEQAWFNCLLVTRFLSIKRKSLK